MTRTLSSVCLFVVMVVSGSVDAAPKKDKIAILGLEVFSGSSGVDAESTRVAQELTSGLRTRPKAGQGPYGFAPGSEKELIDEKLMNDCPDEAAKCMTKIAQNLGTDYLMFGKIEKKSLGTQAGYQISLKLLKVAGSTITNWTDFIPLGDSTGTKLVDWARKGYKNLTHESADGTLVVKTNVERGTILIDGDARGNIVNNKGEVLNLSDGKYKLAVEAKGYQRWESDEPITIRGGETTTQEATLKEARGKIELCDPSVSTCENTTTDTPKTGLWKGMMVAGLVVGGGGGALWIVSYSKINDAETKLKTDPTNKALTDQGKKYQTLSYVGGSLVAVGATVAIIGLIKGYIATGKEKQAAGSSTVGRATTKHSNLSITPVIGPQGTGATLRFDW